MIGALATPALYRGLSSLAAPAIHLWLARRRGQGKEDEARFAERLGHAGLARPEGRLAWAHAASVGESLAVLPLAERLCAEGLNVLITSGTVTSARVLEKRLGAGMMHQYVPIDRPAAVTRFLTHWRPDAAIWVESELWPNLVLAAAARRIPMVMVNARMSERSARRWRRMPRLIAPLLGAFGACLAQSEEDAARLKSLGAPTVRLAGNIKYDAPPLPADEAALNHLRHEIGGRPHWLMASSHPGDEAAAAEAHAALAGKIPGLLTLIAPRHPERGAASRSPSAARATISRRRRISMSPIPWAKWGCCTAPRGSRSSPARSPIMAGIIRSSRRCSAMRFSPARICAISTMPVMPWKKRMP